jgi:hypothetical protein
MYHPPSSASERRPQDQPYFLAKDCPVCRHPLVPAYDPEVPGAHFDEFTCANPTCDLFDSVFLDSPYGSFDFSAERADDGPDRA